MTRTAAWDEGTLMVSVRRSQCQACRMNKYTRTVVRKKMGGGYERLIPSSWCPNRFSKIFRFGGQKWSMTDPSIEVAGD
jgi:hypothetical protein